MPPEFIHDYSGPTTSHGNIMRHVINFLIAKGISLNKFAVNLGADDGITSDPTYALFSTFGFRGVAFEPNKSSFATLVKNLPSTNVIKINDYVTPENVLINFDDLKIPVDADVIKVDIDGYDYFVAKEMLKKYKPKILCIEAQPIFPPKLNFTMNYYKEYVGWDSSMCVGASLTLITKMTKINGYELIYLDWYDAYYVKKDLFNLFEMNDNSVENVWLNGWFNRPRDGFGPKFAFFNGLRFLKPQAQLDFINNDNNFNGKKYVLFHDDIPHKVSEELGL